MRVAKYEVKGSVIFTGSGLGYHFDAASPWPGKLSRIGVLIDLDLFYRRSGDRDTVCLDTVNDDRYTTCTNAAGIQKARHSTDIVLVKNREVLKGVGVQCDAVQVVTG